MRVRSLAQTEAQFTTDIIVCLVAAASVVSGAVALVAMACMNDKQFGELDNFKIYLITGALVAVIVSALKLLGLFGVLKFIH
jgi:hypothetical protein